MYLELFKLTDLPFRLSPDPAFLYLSKHHARAKAYMESTIWFTDGFVIITGDIGSGKTTLIETFLREIGKDVVVAQINQTQVSVVEFLQSVLTQFGFSPFRMKKAELLATLNTFLIEQYSAGRKVLLIVDEAQNLNLRVLEDQRGDALGQRFEQRNVTFSRDQPDAVGNNVIRKDVTHVLRWPSGASDFNIHVEAHALRI